MASSLVFIFLLDNIPGNILNKSLDNIRPFGHQIDNVKQCKNYAEPIVEVIKQKLIMKLNVLAQDNRNIHYLTNTEHYNITSDLFYNIQTALDNSVEGDSSSLDGVHAFNEHDENQSECEASNTNVNINFSPSISNDPVEALPEKVPFLVAIFETLANVTAQTCGGTLLSPHWVLTAASCVNMLSSAYNISSLEDSIYTVIANATNPLVDGTIHNVTDVLLHPESNLLPESILAFLRELHNEENEENVKDKSPSLAMLKIEPPAELQTVEVDDGVETGDVRVYGWVLVEDKLSGTTSMRPSSFPAKVVRPADCVVHYGVDNGIDNKYVLCLSTNDSYTNITEMSFGGPVLSLKQNRVTMTAVALTDDRSRFAAHCTAPHVTWITKTLYNK